ncbi:MAG: prolipoprotein diacylglyceryl transferase [Oligoflexales bacterium]
MDYFAWNFDPEIFRLQLGSFTLAPRYYGLMFAMGFLIGYQLLEKVYRKEGKNIESLSSLLGHMLVGTIVGARLGHCLFYEPGYYLSHPLEILAIWKGGLASHGGTLGILISVYFYTRKHRDQPYIWVADRLAPAIALTAAFIRIGNFFNSEIIGKPATVPWAVIFERIDAVPRHPAMLYESLSYLILFVITSLQYWKFNAARTPGRIIGFFFMWVFGSRILIEFVKENQVDFENAMALNMGQLLSIPFVIAGYLLFAGKIKWVTKNQA